MQKSREALADGRKSIWKRIENKQWTYCSSFMSKTWFYSLAPLFLFFCFLIRNFNSFCSFFYYCNWPENSHQHAYSRHHANKEWLISPTTTLIPGNTSIREGRVFQNRNWCSPKIWSMFFFLILTVQGDIHRKDFKWKNIWRYGVNFWKCSFLYAELKKRAKAPSNSYSVTEDFYNIFIMCLWLRIIRTTDQYVQFLNFPPQIFFWRY